MTLALAGLLLVAPLWAWHIGAGWPPYLRDNAFKTLGVASVVMLATLCWPLAILWGLGLWHWRDPDECSQPDLHSPIAGVLAIGTTVAVFLLASHVPGIDGDWLRAGIVGGGLVQIIILGGQAFFLWRKPQKRQTFHFWRDSLRGSMGNRVVTGGFLAFCFALAPIWLLPVFGIGVLATSSFTAWAAAAIALAIRFPHTVLWWAPGVVMGGIIVGVWRGNPLDSILGRQAIWRLCWDSWRDDTWKGQLLGHGHWIFTRRARWWHSQGLVKDIYAHAHQDALQFLMEYGALGLGAIVALLVLLQPAAHLGDPWTAAVVVGLMVGMNQFTLHLPHTGLPVVVAAGVLWGRLG